MKTGTTPSKKLQVVYLGELRFPAGLLIPLRPTRQNRARFPHKGVALIPQTRFFGTPNGDLELGDIIARRGKESSYRRWMVTGSATLAAPFPGDTSVGVPPVPGPHVSVKSKAPAWLE